MKQAIGAPQALTYLTVVCPPDQEAALGTGVPDAYLASIGAAVQQGLSPIAQ